jgi:GNAT superfamily N-acetyltransferase
MAPFEPENKPATAAGPLAVRVIEVFPPFRLAASQAEAIARFGAVAVDPAVVARLAEEPRQKDGCCLLALAQIETELAGWALVGWCKLHGRWIREVTVDVGHRRRGVGTRLLAYAEAMVRPHELSIEICENDLVGHVFLRAAGLWCRPPWERSRRQRERGIYEFGSVERPALRWRGAPRFTWSP